MACSPLRLIKNAIEYCDKSKIPAIPNSTRGIYVLYNEQPKTKRYDVVYVGMTSLGVKSRLRDHKKSSKGSSWTHFSVFEVWDNIREEEIKELEGLFRHLYRHDTSANRLNKQKSFAPLKSVRSKHFDEWQ